MNNVDMVSLVKRNRAMRLLGEYCVMMYEKMHHDELIKNMRENKLTYSDILIQECSKPTSAQLLRLQSKKTLNKLLRSSFHSKNSASPCETPKNSLFAPMSPKKVQFKNLVFEVPNKSKILRTRTSLKYEEPEKETVTNKPGSNRNDNLIYLALINFEGIIHLMKYSNILKLDIKKLAPVVRHRFCPKGSYVFKLYDRPDGVYGLIKGRISAKVNPAVEYTGKFKCQVDQNYYSKDQKKRDLFDVEFQQIEENNFSNGYFSSDEENFRNINDDNDNDVNDDNSDEEKNEGIKFASKKYYKKSATVRLNVYKDLEEISRYYEEGSCFGEQGVLYNTPRKFSAYCETDTDVFFIPRDDYNKTIAVKIQESEKKKVTFITNTIPLLRTAINPIDLGDKMTELSIHKNEYVYTNFDEAENIFIVYQGECMIIDMPKATSKFDYIMNTHPIRKIGVLTVGGIAGLDSYKHSKYYENGLMAIKDYTSVLKLPLKFLEKNCRKIKQFLKDMHDQQLVINDKLIKTQENQKKNKDNPVILENQFREHVQKYIGQITKEKQKKRGHKNTFCFKQIRIHSYREFIDSIDYNNNNDNNESRYLETNSNRHYKNYSILSLKKQNHSLRKNLFAPNNTTTEFFQTKRLPTASTSISSTNKRYRIFSGKQPSAIFPTNEDVLNTNDSRPKTGRKKYKLKHQALVSTDISESITNYKINMLKHNSYDSGQFDLPMVNGF